MAVAKKTMQEVTTAPANADAMPIHHFSRL
jgi:hypothetical protein